jgi:hypothetical protein
VKDKYFFGRTPTRQIDVFAFPRTGSHLFRYCTAGLFDLMALPQPGLENPEAVERQSELNPHALYALDLREDGVPYAPVWFNARANGQHGFPVKGEAPMVVLIRDPVPTFYSFYRVSIDRWKQPIEDPPTWIRAKCQRYTAFYDAGLEQIAKSPRDSLLIRYEELIGSADPLKRLVSLVGVQPKLDPEFVHSVTRFDQFTRRGTRTFYRAGDNNAWRHDKEWCTLLERADLPDLSRFTCSAPA